MCQLTQAKALFNCGVDVETLIDSLKSLFIFAKLGWKSLKKSLSHSILAPLLRTKPRQMTSD